MSLQFVVPLQTEGYGLKNEDFDEIIIMERLKEISHEFEDAIKEVQTVFDSPIQIRLIEFNESSGANPGSNLFFNQLIFGQRHLFYSHLHSNRDCCVIFLYSQKRKTYSKLLAKRLLFHEFAHHFQWASGEFPCFLPRGTPRESLPRFARVIDIGPQRGEVWIGDLLLEDGRISFLKDFSERISDFVCESILIQKGFTRGLLQEYNLGKNSDPAKSFPVENDPRFRAAIRYMRRLALHDKAEWHSILRRVYPNNSAMQKMLENDKKWVVDLNSEYDKAEQAFDKNYDISFNADCSMFKEHTRAVDYIKEVSSSLGIYIKTEETW